MQGRGVGVGDRCRGGGGVGGSPRRGYLLSSAVGGKGLYDRGDRMSLGQAREEFRVQGAGIGNGLEVGDEREGGIKDGPPRTPV